MKISLTKLLNIQKSIPRYSFVLVASLFYVLFLPIYLLYYRLAFSPYLTRLFKLSTRTFLFTVNKSTEGAYIFKKKNPVWHFYNILFLRKKFLSQTDFKKTLLALAKDSNFSQYLPHVTMYRGRMLVEYLEPNAYMSLEQLKLKCWGSKAQKSTIATNLTKAVNALHQCGYSHGDLKAKNIYINKSDLQVKLIDFEALHQLETNEKRDLSLLNKMTISLLGANKEESTR